MLLGIKIAGEGPVEVGEVLFESFLSSSKRRRRGGGGSSRSSRGNLPIDGPPYEQIGALGRFAARFRTGKEIWAECELLVLDETSPAKMNGCSLAVYVPPESAALHLGSDAGSGGSLMNLYEVRLPVEEGEHE